MITILGAGSWGTALAVVLADNGHQICIWGRNEAVLSEIKTNNSNSKYLPNITLFNDSKQITVSTDLNTAITESTRFIVLAIPSNSFADIIKKIKNIIQIKKLNNIILIGATKGLNDNNGDPTFLDVVVANILGRDYPYCLLSGPSFAKEVALKQPTAVVMAATDLVVAQKAADIFHNKWFRVYTGTDILGVQLCGALKNVLAFAVGCSDGFGLGSNARAAVITRGLREMLRLGMALQINQETLMGLSGLGDLVLSATDNQSRNKRFGNYIGQGLDIKSALEKVGQHVESFDNTKLVYNLAKKYNLDLPIITQAYRVLYEHLNVEDAINNLVIRPRKSE